MFAVSPVSSEDKKEELKGVTYDGRSLIINGKRELLFSGSIHYPRSPPEVHNASAITEFCNFCVHNKKQKFIMVETVIACGIIPVESDVFPGRNCM